MTIPLKGLTVFPHRYVVDIEDMALWLLDHGTDLNKQTYVDLTPMSRAVSHAPPELVRKYLDRGGDVQKGEVLQYAVDRPTDVIEVLGMLLEKGAPLNKLMYENHEPSYGMYYFTDLGTPLHRAANSGKADVVEYLLKWGADPNIRDQMGKGQTALERAKIAGHHDVVRVLKFHPDIMQ